jgi:hypothetical protein
VINLQFNKQRKNKNHTVALSPQAKSADRRPPLVGEVRAGLRVEECPMVPTAVNLDILDRSRYFPLK